MASQALKDLITLDIPSEILTLIEEKERYKVKGTVGVGGLPAILWIAIFDVLVTQTAQSGYYPVFLFADDMSGFYLSLNQGVTSVVDKTKYGESAIDILKLKANDFRAQIKIMPQGFNMNPITLANLKSTKSDYAKLYPAGNIISKYYRADDLPSDIELQTDITEILKVYELITYNEGLPTTEAQQEEDEDYYKEIEDLRKFRFHKRIERNIRLSKKVKQAQGYTCKACKFNFEKGYGPLGKEFIEAHHLKAIAKLTEEKIELDARKDFVVLCSNCHSMIHKLGDSSNLDSLKEALNFKTIYKTEGK